MKTYKSHKTVKAAKIVAAPLTKPEYSKYVLGLEGGNSAVVDRAYLQKHDPKPGGYFVEYADGYCSFSPAKAFEEGYTEQPKTDAEIAASVAASPYPKVTEDSIKARIKSVDYLFPDDTTLTFCLITMVNGFTVTGQSACVDARNFNEETGKHYAYKDAFRQLWPFEGYALADRLATAKAGEVTSAAPRTTGLDFGDAIRAVKSGKRISREGWNGKGMYLFIIQGSNDIAKLHGYGFGEYQGEPTFRDAIFMKTVDNQLVPWTASQSDVLATDWTIG